MLRVSAPQPYALPALVSSACILPLPATFTPVRRHPRAGGAPHLSRTARPSRSQPASPYQPARHGGHLPSPSSAFCGRTPALLWPPSRPALCGTPHASPWCIGPFWGSLLWSFPVLPDAITVASLSDFLLSGFGRDVRLSALS